MSRASVTGTGTGTGAGLRIGAVEPYFGGSHRRFLEDLAAHSAHEFELFTMPARFWKWRMHGAGVALLDDIERLGSCDVLLVSDFLNVAEFLGLARDVWPGGKCPPVALFMHENQLTYPAQDTNERDDHYGLSTSPPRSRRIASGLTARSIATSFSASAPSKQRFPDARCSCRTA